jgi:hypothetical protein
MLRPLLAVLALTALTAEAEDPGPNCEQRISERARCAKDYCAMIAGITTAQLATLYPTADSSRTRASFEQGCLRSLDEEGRDAAARERVCRPVWDSRVLQQFLDAMDRCQAQTSCAAKVACIRPLFALPPRWKAPKTPMPVPGHVR